MPKDGKIRFRCSRCDKPVSVAEQHAGKRGRCPGCGAVIQIPAAKAAELAAGSSTRWYTAQSGGEHVRQVVVHVPSNAEVPARVGNLVPPGQNFMFMKANWAAITLLMDKPNEGPFVFIRAQGVVEQFRHCPLRVGFSHYRMSTGGLFTVLVHVRCPQVEARTGNPAVFENHHNLGKDEGLKLVESLITRDQVEVCFTAAGEHGPCTGYFGMKAPLPRACRELLKSEWNHLLEYHRGVAAGRRDFQACVAQYEQENPMQDNPILDE